MTEQMLDIGVVRTDGNTQPRVAIDQHVVAEYAELIKSGTEMPPVEVVHDGAEYWLVDGFHRLFAHRVAGRPQIRAVVTTGMKADARWLSLAANKTHGLRRTNADKAKAVAIAIRLRPDFTSRAIAEHVGVGETMVRHYRSNLDQQTGVDAQRSVALKAQHSTRKGRDGRSYRPQKPQKRGCRPAVATPVRPHSTPDGRRFVGMATDPAMGARALLESFGREYVEGLVCELRALLDGTAGTPPTFRNLPALTMN